MTTIGHPPETIDFGPLRISFDARVLRPRPWTTAQSAWAAELLVRAPAGPVLELCAGAGQIGLLAIAGSDRRLVCVDLNPVACDYARANAAAAGLADRVEVREGSMTDVLRDSERYPLIVADPPWVRHDDVGRFPDDPLLAIDGGPDGLAVARLCVEIAGTHLSARGSLLLQLGDREQADRVGAWLTGTDLAVVEVRQGERGVLVRIDRD